MSGKLKFLWTTYITRDRIGEPPLIAVSRVWALPPKRTKERAEV